MKRFVSGLFGGARHEFQQKISQFVATFVATSFLPRHLHGFLTDAGRTGSRSFRV